MYTNVLYFIDREAVYPSGRGTRSSLLMGQMGSLKLFIVLKQENRKYEGDRLAE